MVRERTMDSHTQCLEFIVKLFSILHANPDPRSATALVTAAQIDDSAIARNAGEVLTAPACILKTEFAGIETQAGLHVLHAQDRLAVFKMNGDCGRLAHRLASRWNCTCEPLGLRRPEHRSTKRAPPGRERDLAQAFRTLPGRWVSRNGV